jgi:hypothetical protein
MGWCRFDAQDDSEEDPDEAPETPLDEPPPTRVEDPPPQPDQRPYVVRQHDGSQRNGGTA